MDKSKKSLILNKIIQKQREAYEICKDLITKSERNVSYTVKTEIIIEMDQIKPKITIQELPEIRYYHSTPGEDSDYLKEIDIDNKD